MHNSVEWMHLYMLAVSFYITDQEPCQEMAFKVHAKCQVSCMQLNSATF